MKNLGIIILFKDIILFDDVYQENPKEIIVKSDNFLFKIGKKIIDKFNNFFINFEIIYIPSPKINDIDKNDFYYDTVFPFRSGFTEKFILKKLKELYDESNYYRILGIYPGTIWFTIEEYELIPYINGTARSNIAVLSLQTFFEGNVYELLINTIIISCHEIGHTLGFKHHKNCIMSNKNKKHFFCQNCIRKLKSLY